MIVQPVASRRLMKRANTAICHKVSERCHTSRNRSVKTELCHDKNGRQERAIHNRYRTTHNHPIQCPSPSEEKGRAAQSLFVLTSFAEWKFFCGSSHIIVTQKRSHSKNDIGTSHSNTSHNIAISPRTTTTNYSTNYSIHHKQYPSVCLSVGWI